MEGTLFYIGHLVGNAFPVKNLQKPFERFSVFTVKLIQCFECQKSQEH